MDPRNHFVAATAIIHRDGKYLIARRAPHEKVYPNMWTVPGGKLVYSEYRDVPKTTKDAWYGIIDWLLAKEVREETGLEIGKVHYLCDLLFVRPDGFPVLTLSYWCDWVSGEVKLCKDLTDFKWVSVEEAKNYELIEGIREEIELADKEIKAKK